MRPAGVRPMIDMRETYASYRGPGHTTEMTTRTGLTMPCRLFGGASLAVRVASHQEASALASHPFGGR